MTKPNKKNGRPTKYTKALATEICARIAGGESIRRICRDDHIPDKSNIFKWLLSESPVYDGFQDQYAKSRKMQAECLADEIFDISDDGSNDWMDANDKDNEAYKVNGDAIGRSRLRVDTRKWYLSKVLPRFSDKDVKEDKQEPNITINLIDAVKPCGN